MGTTYHFKPITLGPGHMRQQSLEYLVHSYMDYHGQSIIRNYVCCREHYPERPSGTTYWEDVEKAIAYVQSLVRVNPDPPQARS